MTTSIRAAGPRPGLVRAGGSRWWSNRWTSRGRLRVSRLTRGCSYDPPGVLDRRPATLAVGPPNIADRGDPSLAESPAQVSEVLAGEHRRDDRDTASMHPDLCLAHLASQVDRAPARCPCAGPVLDLARADSAELVVVEDRAVGHQQLHHRVVDVEMDLEVAVLDSIRAQVEQHGAASGPHVEAPGSGPVPQFLDGAVVSPDRHSLPSDVPGRGCGGVRRGGHVVGPHEVHEAIVMHTLVYMQLE